MGLRGAGMHGGQDDVRRRGVKRDIVATWPKSRPLRSYLDELLLAERDGLEINFRIANPPHWEFGVLRDRPARCYMVHDGLIRGYNEILYATYRGPGEVARVANDSFAGFWPAGHYIVRDPRWYGCPRRAMRGFQGWRWLDTEAGMDLYESLVNRCVRHGSCLIWTGWKTKGGVAQMNLKRNGKWRQHYVRRVLWEEVHGPIPPGGAISPTCRNQACVNPECMALTTQPEAARAGQLRRWHGAEVAVGG